MTKGHTSIAALGAARMALLAGASVAALFVAGAASAQNTTDGTQTPPSFTPTPSQTYAIGHDGTAPHSPSGVDLSTVSIPGVSSVSTSPMVLLNCIGIGTGCVATDGPVHLTVTNAVNSNGTPANHTYGQEIIGVGPLATYTTNTGATIHAVEGLGANLGMVLVNATTGVPADYGVGFVQDPLGAAQAGYRWVSLNAQDTSSTASPTAKWMAATYANDHVFTAMAASIAVPANPGGGAATWYLSDGNGNPIPGLPPIIPGSPLAIQLSAAIQNHDIAAYNAALAAAGIHVVAVSSTAADPHLTTSATLYTYQGAVSSAQGTGNGTVTTNTGAHASTTSLAGGVVYANDAGSTTAVGAGGLVTADSHGNVTSVASAGLTVKDASGNASGLSASALTMTDAHGNATNLTAGNLALTSNVGYVSISADPTITVSNWAGTDKTTINNGSITSTGTITAGTAVKTKDLTATGNTTLHNLSVTPNSTVSMGDNRVQDVGAPILGTDAANKAYVDKGLNKAYEGTALALAISQPVFLPGQTFAMRAGWGSYEGQNAFGVSAAGVIAHNTFGYGSTVALDGGIGVGSNNGGVAGKAGVTVGFGGGSAPLK